MNITIRTLGAVLAGLLVTASAADAQLSKVDQKCRDSIAKAFGKAVTAGDKVSATCHKGRDSGKVDDLINCNDLDPAQADTKLKFQKAQAKLEDAIQKKCIEAGAGDDVLEHYDSCPEPCETEAALPNPLTSFADVGNCLACLAGDIVERRNADLSGSPAAPPLSKEEGKCHGAINKGYGKRLKTALKDRAKCQSTEDETSLELQPCDTSDPKGKIGEATVKANAGIDGACQPSMLANIDACGGAGDLATLKTCLAAEDDAAALEAFTAAYKLPSTICPVRVDSTILAGTGLSGTTRTYLDVGWKGLAHRMDLPDNYVLSVDVTCPPAAPCGSCTVDGVSSAGPQYTSFSRCLNDMSIECDNPFNPDTECSGNPCVYLLGPPLPLSAANNPVCSFNMLTNDITGTINPEDGSSTLDVNLTSRVHSGVGLSKPCPVCENDTTPQDGLREGTCSGGPNDGDPCDTQAFDATFAKESLGLGVSLDCPLDAGSNISGGGLLIPLELTTGSSSLGFGDACDSPLGFLQCACGICSLDATITCETDLDCSGVGAGTCTFGGGAAQPRQPSDCDDIVAGCVAITDAPAGTNRGQCDDPVNDQDLYCDGVLASRANNRGYVTCLNNASCAGSECDPSTPAPDGCGACTLEQRRECFLNPLTATGDPDLERPLLVDTFCIPPTNAFSVNGSSGLPGPARTGIEMSVDLIY